MKQEGKQKKKCKPAAAAASTQAKKHVKQERKPAAHPTPSFADGPVPPEYHREYLEDAVRVARDARAKGNHPFGCVLVDDENDHVVIEAGNTVVTKRDCTGHAEMNVVRIASKMYTEVFLRHCTLYTSAEPCAMCAGAIYWSGIPRVVYALSEYELKKIAGGATFHLPCREVFARGTLEVEVEGPFKVEGMRKVHKGFWTQEKGHVNGPSQGE